ncbi:MAG: hypothetical protein ABJH68_12945 [Ilumatobacter sp.]|uniref:hypothetical protein n=1 Tax=Ilumatobacter sp. TaxID=1967498 RepID=UPI003297FC76
MGRRLIALGIAALLVTAACGGADDATVQSEDVAPSDAATSTSTTEPETIDTAAPDTVAPDTAATVAPDTAAADTAADTAVPYTAVPDTAIPDTAVPDTASAETAGAGLPAECVAPPVTVVAQRIGSSPLGSDAFTVVDAVAVPIPIVPNPDGAVDATERATLAAATDLLGYSLVFGDSEIEGDGAVFFQFDPTTPDTLRGLVSIYPPTGVPFAAGDVVTYGEVQGLSIPLPTVGMDLSAFDADTNTYLNDPTGQVTVLGVNDDALCLDVDLTWTVDQPDDNTLTIRGVFTGRVLDRSTIVVLG